MAFPPDYTAHLMTNEIIQITTTNGSSRLLTGTNDQKVGFYSKTETMLKLTRSLLVCRIQISSVIDCSCDCISKAPDCDCCNALCNCKDTIITKIATNYN